MVALFIYALPGDPGLLLEKVEQQHDVKSGHYCDDAPEKDCAKGCVGMTPHDFF